MKLEIFSNTPKSDEPVRLALKPDVTGGIIVHAVNSEGRHVSAGDLLSFRPDGTIYLFPDVSSKLGFQTHYGGCIVAQEAK